MFNLLIIIDKVVTFVMTALTQNGIYYQVVFVILKNNMCIHFCFCVFMLTSSSFFVSVSQRRTIL